MPEEIIKIDELAEINNAQLSGEDYEWIVDNDSVAPKSRRLSLSERALYMESIGFQKTQTKVINQSNVSEVLSSPLNPSWLTDIT